jgi:hypothetical protein
MRNIAKLDQTIFESWHPSLDNEHDAVRLQLEKILRHPPSSGLIS